MTLQEKKENLNKDIEKIAYTLKSKKDLLDRLNNSYEPSKQDVLSSLKDYVDIELKTDKYEYILGGDGWSAPWSEIRKGLVATVNVKPNIYLQQSTLNVIETYVKEIHSPDHIHFIE